MDKLQTYETHSGSETQAFAEKFAASINTGKVIALYGDLGYGKTTFVQGLVKGLGIQKKIISPTFTIIREYHEETTSGSINLYHIDLYRIENEYELSTIGITEILHNKENIIVIEWPEKMGSNLPKERVDITLEYIDETTRRLHIEQNKH